MIWIPQACRPVNASPPPPKKKILLQWLNGSINNKLKRAHPFKPWEKGFLSTSAWLQLLLAFGVRWCMGWHGFHPWLLSKGLFYRHCHSTTALLFYTILLCQNQKQWLLIVVKPWSRLVNGVIKIWRGGHWGQTQSLNCIWWSLSVSFGIPSVWISKLP